MKIDNKAEQLLQTQMMTQIFKQAIGDSNEFQLIMESMIKAVNNPDASTAGFDFGEEDLSKLGFGGGEKLDEIRYQVGEDIKSGNMTIDEAVDRASEKYGVDKNLIKAVIKAESSFNPMSKSQAGAMGLMQLMPGTASEMGVDNPYDIEENVDGGTKYLRGLLDMYGDSKELALAAYNAGPGTVRARSVNGVQDLDKLPAETRNYVKNVMKYYGK